MQVHARFKANLRYFDLLYDSTSRVQLQQTVQGLDMWIYLFMLLIFCWRLVQRVVQQTLYKSEQVQFVFQSSRMNRGAYSTAWTCRL